MAIIQVWSAPSCESGAVCFGPLSPWVSASGSEATSTPEAFRVTVPRAVADAASLAEGRCLRVLSQSRGEQWWLVSSVADSDGDAALVSVTAGPLRQLLTVRGLVRDGGTFAFSTGKRSVSDLLNTYVLTNLADDSLSWLSLGTVDYPDLLEIGDLTRATRAAVLDSIEGQTGHTARLRAVYTGSVLTGFALDVVADPAAGLETVPLTTGANLATVQRTRDALRAATVVVPFTSNGTPMDQTEWTVDSVSGTAPAWILLRDGVTGSPWPIREDGQLIGAYLQQRDGTQSQITDSRASDSAVQIASVGTITAGDVATIVRDTAGRPVVELLSPTGVASSRGRLVGTVGTRVTDGRRNLVPNPVFRAWTSDTAPTGYTVGYFGGGRTGRVGRYPRSTTPGTADMTLAVDGAVASGASSIPVRGGVAGQRLYRHEYLTVGSIGRQISADVITFDSTGRATIAINGTTSAAISDGATVTVAIGAPSAGPLRPPAFPDDTTGDVLRLLGERTTLTWPGTPVRSSGAQRINVAAGITVRSNTVEDALGGAWWPSLLLVNTGTGLTLASAVKPSIPLYSTVHYTLTASATLASDTTVSARVIAGVDDLLGGFGTAFIQWQGVRWLSLWIGEEEPTMTAIEGSGSNQLWHRAQDVLASSASGTRYTARGVDLVRLQQEHGTLALGQMVRLRSDLLSLDATVRIVKLDYDFSATESLSLELGAITPRLTGVTVSL